MIKEKPLKIGDDKAVRMFPHNLKWFKKSNNRRMHSNFSIYSLTTY